MFVFCTMCDTILKAKGSPFDTRIVCFPSMSLNKVMKPFADFSERSVQLYICWKGTKLSLKKIDYLSDVAFSTFSFSVYS